MRFRRRSGDFAADNGRDTGDGRNYRLGLIGLVLAAAVILLLASSLNRPRPWGIAAAVVWLATLLTMSVNYLSRIRNPVLTTAAYVGFLVGGFVLVGWSQASPQDLISSRMPDELSVRISGLVFGLLLLLPAGWSVRRWIRNRRTTRAGRARSRPAAFAKTKPGYATRQVDEFLARLDALPDTSEDRIKGRTLIEGARFPYSRGYGYNPYQVAQHLERLAQRYAITSDAS